MTQKRIEISKKPISRETNNFIDNWVSGNLNTNDLKNNLKRTTIYLPEDLHRNLKIKAANQKTTMTDLIIEAIEKDLKQH
ncbi:MAG: hypothetical protein EBQ62_01745 [Alphaproteobacteria bacterium]|jgi:hypothetical protein|nr:hypothetical protein [Alphaproteobacteria bacterium]